MDSYNASIKNYINGIRVLHLFLDLEFKCVSEFQYKLLIKGIARLNPHCPKRAHPITPDLLLRIHHVLEFSKPAHVAAWAAFLLAFFLMARKSNMVPPSLLTFDPHKHLTRGDIFLGDAGLLVYIKWSKTIQTGERKLVIFRD